jgi:hypothetical protein
MSDNETYEQSLARARELIADAQRIADDIIARAQAQATRMTTDAVREAREIRAKAIRGVLSALDQLDHD